MSAKTFATLLTEQADRLQDRRAELDAAMERYLTDEGELRGKALEIPPQETK